MLSLDKVFDLPGYVFSFQAPLPFKLCGDVERFVLHGAPAGIDHIQSLLWGLQDQRANLSLRQKASYFPRVSPKPGCSFLIPFLFPAVFRQVPFCSRRSQIKSPWWFWLSWATLHRLLQGAPASLYSFIWCSHSSLSVQYWAVPILKEGAIFTYQLHAVVSFQIFYGVRLWRWG